MTTRTRLMTAEQLFEWAGRPENADRHFELERGVVVEVPLTGARHGFCANVLHVLGNYTHQHGCGYACGNRTGIVWERSPDTVHGPDVSCFAESRTFAELSPTYAEGLPRLVVEVAPPQGGVGKLTRRILQYHAWGVPLVWLVDPEDRTVTVWRPGRPPELFEAGQELPGGDELPSFHYRVEEFFFTAAEKAPPP